MRVQATNPMDVLVAIKAGKAAAQPEEFRELLETALAGTGREKPSRPPKLKGVAETEKPIERAEPGKDAQPGEAAQTVAAAQMAQQPRETEPQAEPQVETQAGAAPRMQAAQAVLQAAQAEGTLTIPPLPAAQEPTAQQSAGGDILSAEMILPAQPEAAPTVQSGQTVQTGEPQNRLGAMLDRAQQELQSIGNPAEQTEQPMAETPVAELPEAETPTVEQQPEILPPEEEIEPPVAEETAEQPEPETEPEAPQTGARVQTRPEARATEQRPLREIPKADRAVMEMKEAVTAPEQKPEPVRLETAPQPEQPQPLQRPPTGMEQMEQVRVRMTENLAQGRTEFRMQLQPEELGKVDVRLVLEGGKLAVEIIAASPKAAELLAKQTEGLIQSLRMQSIEVQTVNVVTESQSADSHMDGAFNMLNGQAGNSGEEGGNGKPGFGRPSAHGEAEAPAGEEQAAPETLLDYAV